MLKSLNYTEDGIEAVLEGVITSSELYDVNIKMIDDLKPPPYKFQLWRFENVKDFTVSAQELRTIALQDVKMSKTYPDIKIAIVSDSSLAFGLGRMYEAFAEESLWETMVFYTIEDAREWIDS